MTPEQLQAARAERWRQKSNPVLTLDDAAAWVDAMGLSLFLPRRNQFLTPAPSFVEACIGAPSDIPSPAEIGNAGSLMIRLTENGTALPLNLFGGHTDQPDFLASRDVFPYIFSLRGGRNWKTPPPKATPLMVEIWKLLEPGASLETTEIQAALGREITEAAALRGLMELWGGLRVMPVYTQDGPTRWELTQARFSDAMTAANKIAQTTGLSALVSLYLESVIAATPEEIETFISPLTARSKVREVVNGLMATRQLAIVPVGTQTMVHVAGSLPEFEEPEQPPIEPPKAEPKPAFEGRREFRKQRPPFRREQTGEQPRDRSQTRPPSRDRFAAREGDRGKRQRPPREGERRESRPFRKFDQGKGPERYPPRTAESGGERRPFRPRPVEDAGRTGRKFPPKKFGAERERPRIEKDRERPQYGAERERPPKKVGGKRPFLREGREEARPRRDADRPKEERQDQGAGFQQRRGEWKPSRFGKPGFGKPGKPQSGRSKPGGARPQDSQFRRSPFKGQRRDREDRGGRPEGRGQGGGKFAGKKFVGPKPRGKSGGFKSGPKPGGSKPPFRNGKDKKWKNKGKKNDGKNPE